MITGIPTGTVLVNSMIIQYIETALAHARYDMIDDEEPFYGEVPELPGVWATGKTLEECRRNLVEVIDGWIIVRLRRGLPIPPIDNCTIEELTGMDSGVPA
jgi:predicted RNase H-like HicB family nuclease